jgi:prophage tail gpP-like protein
MADLQLIANGRRYGGWRSIQVTRSIETLAGSFALLANDRWAQQEIPWAIAEEDECRIEIDGEPVITGFVEKRRKRLSAPDLPYTGIDRAGELVANSADLTEWTYRNITLDDFARRLAAPFGVGVRVDAGITLPKIARISVAPGDTVFEAISAVARDQEVLLVSDGRGDVLITRSGSARAASLIEGENLVDAEIDYDASQRYSRYVMLSQVAGTDEASGAATSTRAVARDLGVRRTNRVQYLRGDGLSNADARRRADWEARIRAARSERVTAIVRGWRQPIGGRALWAPNLITLARIPYIGIDGDMLISQVDYSVDDAGEVTTLALVRPDAFAPEPTATVKSATGAGQWKELAGGGR